MVSVGEAIRKAEMKVAVSIIEKIDKIEQEGLSNSWWVKVGHAAEDAKRVATYDLPVRFYGKITDKFYLELVNRAKELAVVLEERARFLIHEEERKRRYA